MFTPCRPPVPDSAEKFRRFPGCSCGGIPARESGRVPAWPAQSGWPDIRGYPSIRPGWNFRSSPQSAWRTPGREAGQRVQRSPAPPLESF